MCRGGSEARDEDRRLGSMYIYLALTGPRLRLESRYGPSCRWFSTELLRMDQRKWHARSPAQPTYGRPVLQFRCEKTGRGATVVTQRRTSVKTDRSCYSFDRCPPHYAPLYLIHGQIYPYSGSAEGNLPTSIRPRLLCSECAKPRRSDVGPGTSIVIQPT